MKRCVALCLIGVILVCGCVKPKSTTTVKSVVSKVIMYVGLAKTLISVAKTHYKGNEKVKKSVDATEKALFSVQSTMLLVESGLEKDYGLLGVRLVVLMQAIFDLKKSIQEARNQS